MIQNSRSLEIFGDGLEALSSPLPLLASEYIDDLLDQSFGLVETFRGLNLQGRT